MFRNRATFALAHFKSTIIPYLKPRHFNLGALPIFSQMIMASVRSQFHSVVLTIVSRSMDVSSLSIEFFNSFFVRLLSRELDVRR